jgi:hypothetical protein
MFYINPELETKERYDLIKFLEFDNGAANVVTSFMLTNIPRLSPVGTYTVRRESGRPDLLSHAIYKDLQYWWVLMWYNSLVSVNDLVSGMVIEYPSLSAVERLYTRASTLGKSVKTY